MSLLLNAWHMKICMNPVVETFPGLKIQKVHGLYCTNYFYIFKMYKILGRSIDTKPTIPSSRGLSTNLIVILASSFGLIALLAIVMGLVHMVGKRYGRKPAFARDTEASGRKFVSTPRFPEVTVAPRTYIASSPVDIPRSNTWTQPVPLQGTINMSQPQKSMGGGYGMRANRGPQPPLQTYDPATRRTIYWG